MLTRPLRAFTLAASLLLQSSGAFAADPAKKPEPPKLSQSERANLVTQETVNYWCAYWQTMLHLGDWNVEVKIVRPDGLQPETVGNIKWDLEKRTALIKVLSPLDYEKGAEETKLDIENTIAHELVHLHLSILPRAEKGPEEELVNKITDALMALEKRRQGRDYQLRSFNPAKPATSNDAGTTPAKNVAPAQAALEPIQQ